ncbi:MAG: hypothetical protein ACLP8A_12080 [Methylovirgula sp.]
MADVSQDEFKVLRAILTNEFHSEPPGEARIGSAIFCESLDAAEEPCGFKDGKILSVIVSSLVNKKLVVTDGETIELTADGYVAATDAM